MALRISRALRAQLLAEAAATPEHEVCGLLFGPAADVVTKVQPCANIASNPVDTFEIDPAALIAAHKAERAGRARLIGCYHSHPNGVDAPSVRDREAAWGNDAIWLIVAGDRLAAWKNTGPGAFERVDIESEG